ncbi:MAG: enoyl-CoA hydratase/isomerase family protein [Chloroflexi bacterium]|nr:enoyl-CoA hydratase/isomerase family protein [Chloroflexota bacterium]
MAFKTLRLDASGPIAVIKLARPDSGNRLDDAFLRELDDACATINDDAGVRVAILTAEGGVFCSGWDGDGLVGRADPFACLESMGQPIICALNGEATSAGLELALACDVRIAAESATFSLPETAQGQLPMGGGTQRLARLVGRGEALRLILLGEEIDAAEAYRIGLVSAVFPRDQLDDNARTLAERMASRGPLALRYAKEAVRRGLEQPLDQALRYETDLTVILQSTDDRAEGVKAFLEKRAPKFEGK